MILTPSSPPVLRDLVLVGGGHSHIAVIRAMRMRPMAGLRVTLVSRAVDTPYSGMLPGVVAGTYTRDEAHIDLVRLCRHCGVRFVIAEVSGLDPDRRILQLTDRPPLRYDVLSLNTGSTPAPAAIDPDAAAAVIFTKPIDGFLRQWEQLRERVRAVTSVMRIAIVGGGVAGAELALAIVRRLEDDGVAAERLEMEIVTAGAAILENHVPRARTLLMRSLTERGIVVRTRERVSRVNVDSAPGSSRVVLQVAGGRSIDADAVIWATQASPAAWLAESALATTADGFVSVNEYLQSVSHENVFAVGDVASSTTHPRPKAGVFAVRQGKPLAKNLRRCLVGRPLQRFVPQRRFLSLIGTADGKAIAARGAWATRGRWAWRWKDRIDRRFMERFTVADRDSVAGLAALPMRQPDPAMLAREDVRSLTGPHADGMRCAGCGSKTSADVLSQALTRLQIAANASVVSGIGTRDDAAIVRVPADRSLALSVDAFRPIVEDPFVFGQITANHCLNDLYAMGAMPMSALAHVILPTWPAAKLGEELFQMLAGALNVLEPAGASLVGGHTGEGSEISLGFTVIGTLEETRAFPKTGHRVGDRLILTRAIGTGCLFAADMRAQAGAAAFAAALAAMRTSNRAAADCLGEHGAHAVTDVTGFGLAGHLTETLQDDAVCARLLVDAVPMLPGSRDALARGWVSSLHDANRRWAEAGIDDSALRIDPELEIRRAVLFDPQTAGPLLASVPRENAQACVAALHGLGYAQACEIGEICERGPSDSYRIRLQCGR